MLQNFPIVLFNISQFFAYNAQFSCYPNKVYMLTIVVDYGEN